MITIIGGSGFVGSRLISTIGKSNCVNLDKNKSPLFNSITKIGNILNIDDLNFQKETKAVVLLAAEHKDNVSPHSMYYDVNVRGTNNVLKKMDQFGIKNLIFTSSVAVYGLNKSNPDESHDVDPFNHYGRSKLEAEKLIKKWYLNDSNEKSVTIIRPTVIFGERNRGNVYNLLKQISSGKFLMIGNGLNKKSMAYVGNVVSFIENRLKKNEIGFEIFNYVDGPDLNMLELSSLIEKKMKIKIPKIKIPYLLGLLGGYSFDALSKIFKKKTSISSVRVKKFCATTQFNATKAHCSFNAPYSLEEGLNKTLDFEFNKMKKDNIIFFSE